MIFAVALLSGVFIHGFLLMVFELWNAPEGYQDHAGFHVTKSARDTIGAGLEVSSKQHLAA